VGKYEVVSRLATGGMAEIYLARATGIEGFQKHVVLKRILPQFAQNETFVKLFLNEARVAATLDHPNIGSVYDIGQTDGVYFFTMEYLHGEDTGHILTELARRRVRFPIDHALTIVSGVCAGLQFAHEKKGPDGKPLGIVHRDISPSNVVVTYDGGVKLVDFGIAKITASAEMTGTGSLKGKIAYMSPEQCSSQPIDRRSDVFSMGVLLFEMTTHTRLFKADTEIATLNNVREAIVPSPTSRVPGYPPELEAIVKKALARVPAERYATARELQLAIETFAQRARMSLSNALLGEWMVKTFGPKMEPWHGLTPSVTLAEPTRGDEGVDDPHAERPTSVEAPTGIDAPAERRRQRRVWIALASTGVVAAAGTAMAFRTAWSSFDDAARSPPPNIVVVSEQGSVSVDPSGGKPPPPTPPAPAAVAAATPEPAPSPAVPAPPRRPKPRNPEAARSAQYTAAFGRKNREIEQCFNLHQHEAQPSAGKVSIHFQADVEGRVVDAEVKPEGIARSPLGACLAKVASSTNFGPQPQPVAFSIPVMVTARRGGSNGQP
jgi:serine/threonine protein kinase